MNDGFHATVNRCPEMSEFCMVLNKLLGVSDPEYKINCMVQSLVWPAASPNPTYVICPHKTCDSMKLEGPCGFTSHSGDQTHHFLWWDPNGNKGHPPMQVKTTGSNDIVVVGGPGANRLGFRVMNNAPVKRFRDETLSYSFYGATKPEEIQDRIADQHNKMKAQKEINSQNAVYARKQKYETLSHKASAVHVQSYRDQMMSDYDDVLRTHTRSQSRGGNYRGNRNNNNKNYNNEPEELRYKQSDESESGTTITS